MRIAAIGALTAAVLLTSTLPADARTITPTSTASTSAAGAAAPSVTTPEAYLIDATTGTALFAKRETRKVAVASLTKVMTAYVVRKRARLDDVVTITTADVRHATANDGSNAGLRPGERLTVRDLLYAMMLPSGADAAHALAERYGPGTPRFVARMNDAARRLRLTGTRYANPDGLPSSGYSTARDQATLAGAAMKDPVIAAVAKTRKRAIGKTSAHRAHVWRNTNKLLDEGALGLKTGYTYKAGYCLTFVAEQDGHKLVGVILGARNDVARFGTARSLLSWAEESSAGGGTPGEGPTGENTALTPASPA
jgi:D-alanyl-D-alanine carboxypeptidase (penicillin-binding protein 5/6)